MTYSMIARDPATGELGVGVQSRYFAAGRDVPWIEAGLGVIVSQSIANPAYGYETLRLLRSGLEPQPILEKLLSEDPEAPVRQVAILDAQGRIAVHTGTKCVSAAGHATGVNCCAQANMMAQATVWQAMVDAFENADGELADRLVAAMEAAEQEGGDIRGKQAASLIVVSGRSSGVSRLDRSVDLRVDDHPDPVGEVKRLLSYSRALQRANQALDKIMANDFTGALADLDICCAAYPNEPDFLLRRGWALFPLGRIDEARAMMQRAHAIHAGWSEFVLRLADAGVIPLQRAMLEPLMAGLVSEEHSDFDP